MIADRTIDSIIQLIVAEMVGKRWRRTVDTVKTGDPTVPVCGIVTTFLATVDVIRRSHALGANLIISHEPTFYNHDDSARPLAHDPICRDKRQLLDDAGIVVWRLHDYIHGRAAGDGIIAGLLRALDWTQYTEAERPFLCALPAVTLGDLVELLKQRLQLENVRVVGDRSMTCRRIGLVVGASGFAAHRQVLREYRADTVICGEIHEWETSIYVQDAIDLGRPTALIILGHAHSEEAGMAWVADWLRQRVSGIPIHHVPAGDPVRTL